MARAVYKLKTIDEKTGLLKQGNNVLDLGCCPGSWLQYADKQVGPSGHIVGIDRDEPSGAPGRARIIIGDVFEISAEALLAELPHFDVVLSDMAPDTTGIRSLDQDRSEALFEHAYFLATETLCMGGHFAAKLFQGRDFQNLQKMCRERFERVKPMKPESSRKKSIEQYIVCLGFKG